MTTIAGILGALMVLGIIVAIHEFGHFLAMRIAKVPVEVFSIGFGPALWSRRFGDLTLRIGVLPLGGYVRPYTSRALARLSREERQSLRAKSPHIFVRARRFEHTTPARKLFIAAAGPGMNVLAAFMLALLWLTPSSELPIAGPPSVIEVAPDSRAAEMGLKAGDCIHQVNDEVIQSARAGCIAITRSFVHGRVTLLIERAGNRSTLEAELPVWDGVQEIPQLGIALADGQTIAAPSLMERSMYALNSVWNNLSLQARVLRDLVLGRGSIKEMGGPVSMVSMVKREVETGRWEQLIVICYFLHLVVAFMNLLPIPVLDGGHIFLAVIEQIRGRPLKGTANSVVLLAGLALVLLMSLGAIGIDVWRFTR